MQQFARIVLGYHGCLDPIENELLTGKRSVKEWPMAENSWDWLGRGIYFWEHSPRRALEWAQARAKRDKRDIADARVIGAVIQLGRCFDLTDLEYTRMLRVSFEQLQLTFEAEGRDLPENRGPGDESPIRELDCLVINSLLDEISALGFETVRCPFWEGKPAFPGAKIREQSHVQLAVREDSCILGVFRPNLELDDGTK